MFTRKFIKAFTLLEIMIALSLFGSIFGTISYMVVTAMAARSDAVKLNQAIFLARQKMEDTRGILKEITEEGKYDTFPGYSFKYVIKQEEINIFDFFNKTANSSSAKIQKQIEKETTKVSGNKGAATLGIINVLHYTVTVFHTSNIKYTVDYYRALKFKI